MFTYATPAFVHSSCSAPSCYSSTAAFNDWCSELTPYTALFTLIGLFSMTRINAKPHPLTILTNSCHITAVEQPMIWGSYHATSYH